MRRNKRLVLYPPMELMRRLSLRDDDRIVCAVRDGGSFSAQGHIAPRGHTREQASCRCSTSRWTIERARLSRGEAANRGSPRLATDDALRFLIDAIAPTLAKQFNWCTIFKTDVWRYEPRCLAKWRGVHDGQDASQTGHKAIF